MAEDNHASYAKVGLTVVLGVAAVVGSLIYFGGAGRDKCVFMGETYYDDPVSGLSVGSEVPVDRSEQERARAHSRT